MLWPLSLLTRERINLGRVGWLPYSLPNYSRFTHLYAIGTSGTGKSKFLEDLFVTDVLSGRGCGLIDPHGDLAHDVLTNLLSAGFFKDPRTLDRVIYFDPSRTDYTIAFNVLKSRLPPYTLANQVIESFRRTWPQSLQEAPRFTNILLAALLALIEAGRTLVETPLFLTDPSFREQVLADVKDQNIVEFFHNRYDRWGKGFTIESVLNKVTAFTLNPHLRRSLGAQENSLDLRHIMDSGKVLIANLGNCDDETRRLIGSLLTTGFEQAAMSRADDRRHFYLYIDEFQDFVANDGGTQTLAHILSECRKYNMHIHLAHQTMGQIQKRVESALGNVNLLVVFALDHDDARVFAYKLFVDYAGRISWDEATAMIQKLPRRTAFIKWRGGRLTKIRTQDIPEYQVTAAQIEELIKSLLRKHGQIVVAETPQAQVQKVILADWEQSVRNVDDK